MGYKVDSDRVSKDGKRVEMIASPYIGGVFASTPKIIVMHFTYGSTARSSAEWFRSKNNPGSSAHVVIDRDGTVLQCVSLDHVAWHAGKSRWRDLIGLNQHAFGIELANWGYLRRSQGGGWSSYTGVPIADPFLAVHRNGNPDGSTSAIGWEPYPAAQIEAAVAVARALQAAFGIDEIVGHDDIAPTRKWDPGPAFDMTRFRAAVFGGRGQDDSPALHVAVAGGLNLRAGPGTQFDVIRQLANGTALTPISQSGLWLEVSVLDPSNHPLATGWVHGHYIKG